MKLFYPLWPYGEFCVIVEIEVFVTEFNWVRRFAKKLLNFRYANKIFSDQQFFYQYFFHQLTKQKNDWLKWKWKIENICSN